MNIQSTPKKNSSNKKRKKKKNSKHNTPKKDLIKKPEIKGIKARVAVDKIFNKLEE